MSGDQIGFAIVGCGLIGPFHARAIGAIPGARLVAVVDEVESAAARMGAKFEVPHHTDLDAALAMTGVDAVCVCVPSGRHAEIGIRAAAAGKHVVVEKPIDVTLAAADRLIDACRKAGVALTVISQHRFDDGVRRLRALIGGGGLGRLVLGDAVIKWHRTQEYYDGGAWRGTVALDGGGSLINQGVHYVDLLRWLMGPVDSVVAQTRTAAHRIEVEDIATALVAFRSGAVGTIEATTAAYPGLPERLELTGERGTAIVEDGALVRFDVLDGRDGLGSVKEDAGAGRGSTSAAADPAAIPFEGHRRQIADFVASIREGRAPLVGGEDGRAALELVLGVYRAAARGSRVWFPLPPAVERVDRLDVEAFRNRAGLGEAAAARVAALARRAIERRGEARIVFASAPSQREFLSALRRRELDWSRVVAFHMDEYLGLAASSPRSFSWFLREHLFRHVAPGQFHAIDGTADPGAEARRYAKLLAAAPIDVVCCGIGENGHLAFNDPPEARFDDPLAVREVAISEASLRQQVHDGMFGSLDEVPTHALTLTLPALFAAEAISCVAPGPAKREAVRRTLREPVSAECPASILRRHPRAVLQLDVDSYSRSDEGVRTRC